MIKQLLLTETCCAVSSYGTATPRRRPAQIMLSTSGAASEPALQRLDAAINYCQVARLQPNVYGDIKARLHTGCSSNVRKG